jgi:glutamine amidotransferase
MSAVAILDLGMGNLRSVSRALERAGATPVIVRDADAVADAERLVVPGQGQFRDCASALGERSGALAEAVHAFVARGRPYLGICLGMQALFTSSEEAPGARGLGVFAGSVVRFPRDIVDPVSRERLKVPHVGWSQVEGRAALHGWFYFVHSFHCVPEDPSVIAAHADHGARFCAAVARANVLAVQFHPEKSGAAGHALIASWLGGAWS